MRKMLLGCALLVLAAGCAPTPLKRVNVRVVEMSELRDTGAAPNKTFVCEEGPKTGSQLKGTQCQSLAEKDRQREAAQDALHRMMMSGSRQR